MQIIDKVKVGKGDFLYNEILLENNNFSIRNFFCDLYNGKSLEKILIDNPNITNDDVLTCYQYALELIGAIDFKTAKSSINKVIVKREAFLKKLEGLKMPEKWNDF